MNVGTEDGDGLEQGDTNEKDNDKIRCGEIFKYSSMTYFHFKCGHVCG